MARGVLAGFIAGTAAAGIALAVASLLTALPDARTPEAAAVEVPAGSEFNRAREDRAADDLPGTEAVPETARAPAVDAPAPDDLSALSGADTAPVTAPETGAPEAVMVAPEDGPGAAPAPDGASPPPAAPQRVAPQAPVAAGDPAIAVQPVQPLQPLQPVQPALPAIEDEDSGAFPAPPAAGAAADLQAGAVPGGIGDRAAQAGAAGTGPPSEVAAPGTGAESRIIGNRAEGVTTDRLPAITDSPAPAPRPDAVERPSAALRRHAVAFDNPEGAPLMAIVLIDDAGGTVGPEALDGFPHPLSLAIDAQAPAAAEVARARRAAGFEVLVLADLPEAASASDTETAMQGILRAVPGAVAVLEGPGRGLQSSRAAVAQLVPILLDSGHGLVLQPRGLNAAQRLIARDGVPALTLFRDLDGDGQGVQAIRRFLDQAALRAAQDEAGVVVLGRLRADTVRALRLWGLQERTGGVALAPVSAVLRAAMPGG